MALMVWREILRKCGADSKSFKLISGFRNICICCTKKGRRAGLAGGAEKGEDGEAGFQGVFNAAVVYGNFFKFQLCH